MNETRFSNIFIEKRVSSCLESLEKSGLFFLPHSIICSETLKMRTDLFLSAFEPDVKQAIDSDVAAGKILTGTSHFDPRAKIDQIRIAFDGDAVLFASESERIYQHEGMQAFMENERVKADIPLQKGLFANFLLTIAHI